VKRIKEERDRGRGRKPLRIKDVSQEIQKTRKVHGKE